MTEEGGYDGRSKQAIAQLANSKRAPTCGRERTAATEHVGGPRGGRLFAAELAAGRAHFRAPIRQCCSAKYVPGKA